ncbi:unnamed protein product, partial [Ranitomeya imitator]
MVINELNRRPREVQSLKKFFTTSIKENLDMLGVYELVMRWRIRISGFRPITQLYFSGISAFSVNVSWTDPSPPADRFILSYTPIGGDEPIELSLDASIRQTQLLDLMPSTEYLVTLLPVHGTLRAELVEGTVTTGVGPPMDVYVINVTDGSMTVVWRPPPSSFHHYRLSYQSTKGRMDSVVIGNDQTQYTLTNLQPTTEYRISLSSVWGREESERVTITAETALDPPFGLRASNITDSGAVLEWEPPKADVESYVITLTHHTAVDSGKMAAGRWRMCRSRSRRRDLDLRMHHLPAAIFPESTTAQETMEELAGGSGLLQNVCRDLRSTGDTAQHSTVTVDTEQHHHRDTRSGVPHFGTPTHPSLRQRSTLASSSSDPGTRVSLQPPPPSSTCHIDGAQGQQTDATQM